LFQKKKTGQKRGLKEDHISYIAGEVVKGLEFMHRKNIAHRDIKAANILVNAAGEIKLGNLTNKKKRL